MGLPSRRNVFSITTKRYAGERFLPIRFNLNFNIKKFINIILVYKNEFIILKCNLLKNNQKIIVVNNTQLPVIHQVVIQHHFDHNNLEQLLLILNYQILSEPE